MTVIDWKHIIIKDALTDMLIEMRRMARDVRQWTDSDLIREELDSRNCFVFDHPTGQEVYHLNTESFYWLKLLPIKIRREIVISLLPELNQQFNYG